MLGATSVIRPRAVIAPALRRAALPALAVGAILCALLAQHQSDPRNVPAWVIGASLLAVCGAALALPGPVWQGEVWCRCADNLRGLTLAGAMMAIGALTAIALWSRERFPSGEVFSLRTSSYAALLWLAGLGAGLLLAWRARDGRSPAGARAGRSYRPALEVSALCGVLALAAALRLWHLDSLPEGIWFDEVDSAADALRLQHLPFQPFAPGNIGHNPSLYFYVMAGLLRLGGDGITAIRLTSVLFGLLAVAAVYLVGRRVGGAGLGLCAATLLAVAQWAIDFSRVGMPDIAAPATIGLGVAAFCAAMQQPQGFRFALAGILLGLSVLTYEGAYVPCAALLGLAALRLLLDLSYRRAAWPAAALLPVGLLAGLAPLLVVLHQDASYVFWRVNSVSLSHEYPDWGHFLPALWENARKHLLMFTVAGDRNGRHNLPGAPMLDTVSGACLLLGLGICLRRWRSWFSQLLLIWLSASLVGGVLSLDGEAPQGARTIGALAPVALIAALPLALLAQAALRNPGALGRLQQGWRRQTLAGSATAAALVLAAAGNIDGYFVRHARDLPSWLAMDGTRTIAGREAATLAGGGYSVRIDPAIAGDPALQYPVLRFAAGGLSPVPFDPHHPLPRALPPGGIALIFSATNAGPLAALRRHYPRAPVVFLAPAFDRTKVQAVVILLRPAP